MITVLTGRSLRNGLSVGIKPREQNLVILMTLGIVRV